jgi:hemerythrin superfamily protein
MNSMNSVMNKISPSATNMIRMDHTHVLASFHQYAPDSRPQTKRALADGICLALEIHAQLEEEIFYPALRGVVTDANVLDKSVPEHNEIKRHIERLRNMDATDAQFEPTLMQLMRDVMHHVADEETVLLPEAERMLGQERLSELGGQMTKRRLQLMAPRAGEMAMNTMRALPTSTVLMAAGVVIAGTYFARRAMRASHLS